MVSCWLTRENHTRPQFSRYTCPAEAPGLLSTDCCQQSSRRLGVSPRMDGAPDLVGRQPLAGFGEPWSIPRLCQGPEASLGESAEHRSLSEWGSGPRGSSQIFSILQRQLGAGWCSQKLETQCPSVTPFPEPAQPPVLQGSEKPCWPPRAPPRTASESPKVTQLANQTHMMPQSSVSKPGV